MTDTMEVSVIGNVVSRDHDIRIARSIEKQFGSTFSFIDSSSGELLRREEDSPFCDTPFIAEMARGIHLLKQAEILWEEDSIAILGLPLSAAGSTIVAVASFLTRPVEDSTDFTTAAATLGVGVDRLATWAADQEVYPIGVLLRLGNAVLEGVVAEARSQRLEGEIDTVCNNLTLTYEEINVLYGVTQNLHISKSDEELGQLALERLIAVVPAQCLAIQYLPVAEPGNVSHEVRTEATYVFAGEAELNEAMMRHLIDSATDSDQRSPIVLNRRDETDSEWLFYGVHQIILVPLISGKKLIGWLVAINHVNSEEFGTVEANLLSSVAAILGIHGGNLELYRQQAELLANVVKALTSAIDAKDPYTCGHSDRVARISVRLAREMGCDAEALNTIYMGGLLHDVGKIGIDDHVLRKPGRLSEAEFNHIKMHPELGHSILCDVKQLHHVLPIVMHHHEQWDGKGYPHLLAGEDIPLLARIVAVADAYDAMTSDRPYRSGLPHEKVDSIFQSGAGQQWDSKVVDALFSMREDILEITNTDPAELGIDVQMWTC